jgi:hypothetical protein
MYKQRSRKRKTPEQEEEEQEAIRIQNAEKLARCLACRFFDENRKPKCSKTYKEEVMRNGKRVCVWWKRKWAEGIKPIDLED